jgi:c-di-GMP-binding flagellar brake protein YcgR
MSASLSNEEIEDKYFLSSQVEILSVLNELAHRREPISVYFNAGQHFILTVLLSARPDGLVFDLGGDEKANRLLAKAQQCVFMGFPDGVKIQFTGINPERFMWGDQEAFWVPIPERIVRLQRRDTYRILLPIIKPPHAKLYDDKAKLLGEWRIHDLSVAGFSIYVEGEPSFKAGDIIPQATINIAAKSPLFCPVVIRHTTMIERTRLGKYQVGFNFVDLPHVMDIAIQKTILTIEYERHKLQGK